MKRELENLVEVLEPAFVRAALEAQLPEYGVWGIYYPGTRERGWDEVVEETAADADSSPDVDVLEAFLGHTEEESDGDPDDDTWGWFEEPDD